MDSILAAPQKNRTTWKQLIVFSIRTLLGMGLGIVLAVAGQEVVGYGKIATTMVVLTTVFLMLKVTKKWSLTKVLILVLNIILLFVFLKIYILVAPGE